jgi:prepilin-type N-terminal cleavage/methylation domain-containing protein
MKHRTQRGFSMIELLVVIAIILVVSAMALPSMNRSINTIRLRSGMSDIAGLLQKGRMEAVRSNRIMVVRSGTLDDGLTPIFYVDGANDPSKKVQQISKYQDLAREQWEPLIAVNKDITIEDPSSAPSFDSDKLLGYAAAGNAATPVAVAFNQRGLPCIIQAQSSGFVTSCDLGAGYGVSQTSTAAYQYFFKYKSTFGTLWGSITVTPAGRVRVWTWNGTEWS